MIVSKMDCSNGNKVVLGQCVPCSDVMMPTTIDGIPHVQCILEPANWQDKHDGVRYLVVLAMPELVEMFKTFSYNEPMV